MSTWNVQATVSLETHIEPSGYLSNDELLDFSDESSFYGETVSAEGSVSFKVEADTEEEATDAAERGLADYTSFHGDDIEWEITDSSIDSIERDEMSRDEAFIIVRRLLDRLVAANHITSEEREALDLVIQDS